VCDEKKSRLEWFGSPVPADLQELWEKILVFLPIARAQLKKSERKKQREKKRRKGL